MPQNANTEVVFSSCSYSNVTVVPNRNYPAINDLLKCIAYPSPFCISIFLLLLFPVLGNRTRRTPFLNFASLSSERNCITEKSNLLINKLFCSTKHGNRNFCKILNNLLTNRDFW